MPISGSVDYSVTRDDIITEALEIVGVLGEGEFPNPQQLASSSRTLNLIIKTWQSKGLNLFAVQNLYLFPQKNKTEYTIQDHITPQYWETQLAFSATEGGVYIEPRSVENITEGSFLGIHVEGQQMFWTTVVSITGNYVELADPLTRDFVANTPVVHYQQKANRPMKLLEGYYRPWKSSTNIPVIVTPRGTYNKLSPNAGSGYINQVYYDSLLNASFKVWPQPQSEWDVLKLVVQKTLSDLDDPTDNPEYPQEWYLPLAYALALAISTKHGVPDSLYYKIKQLAEQYYEMAEGFDAELETSVYLQPEMRR